MLYIAQLHFYLFYRFFRIFFSYFHERKHTQSKGTNLRRNQNSFGRGIKVISSLCD
ncbi:hypothetical protein GIB67_014681 [Kingdonia uniflora]|uniref:Uncharacterized protein n=1 Tax=Kingdonia uniflora TaxID=39325 RepID=A0A7J7LY97_9MAGN|nr:hypothetical protein GIB67_014681 [Kingdonia uniflora]